MAQQTAVEYLLEKLYTEYRFSFSGTIVEQAKEMEKEQIKNAYIFGIQDEYVIGSQRYYNETFKSE